MKKYFKFLVYFLITGSIFIAVSCQDDPLDVPPVVVPRVDFKANTTLIELKRKFASTNLQQITDDIIIKGVVISTDESGNIYKSLYIQDDSAGLEISIDRTDMFKKFQPGQMLYIKCNGLYMYKYHDALKLGSNVNKNRIAGTDTTLSKFFFKDSLPGIIPEPKLLNLDSLSDQYIGMLVRLDNICFPDSGQIYAANEDSNHDIFDAYGNKIILRTSSYATFKSNKLPTGRGSIVGIFSRYNDDYQIYLRDINDVKF